VLAERLPGDNLNTDEELLEYAYRFCKTDHHPAGTCAMGTGPEAVVTPDLKLRGIDGLRVVDASVMPFIPSRNTNAPTMMVARKSLRHHPGEAAASGGWFIHFQIRSRSCGMVEPTEPFVNDAIAMPSPTGC
jgi:choline dehydrogenase-like flavoprotein